MKGFLRDKSSVFFAVVFPLMFLVLFGGLFADQTQSKVDMVVVRDVSLIDDLPADADAAFEETFHVEHSDDLDAAIREVRKGDADVAVEMQGDTLVAHYTQTDQVKAAITQGALRAFVDGTNVAQLSTSSGRPPKYDLEAEKVEDDSLKTIRYYTPGLLGWAVAMSAAFGAAATIQGWRQSKLIRRLHSPWGGGVPDAVPGRLRRGGDPGRGPAVPLGELTLSRRRSGRSGRLGSARRTSQGRRRRGR